MSWRAGPRETVKPGDPLARDPHPLTLAHRERFEDEVREKFRRLFGREGCHGMKRSDYTRPGVEPWWETDAKTWCQCIGSWHRYLGPECSHSPTTPETGVR